MFIKKVHKFSEITEYLFNINYSEISEDFDEFLENNENNVNLINPNDNQTLFFSWLKYMQ
jgi:hypothetical protein